MLQVTRASAFALCLSQVAVTLAVIAYYPPVHVQLYTCHPRVENGTLTLPQSQLSVSNVGLSVPFLILSCLAVLFSTTTAGLSERGQLQQDTHYSFEVLHESGLWDAIFWAFCAGAHAIVIPVVMSPADVYAVSIASILMIYFLGRLCAPRFYVALPVGVHPSTADLAAHPIRMLLARPPALSCHLDPGRLCVGPR